MNLYLLKSVQSKCLNVNLRYVFALLIAMVFITCKSGKEMTIDSTNDLIKAIQKSKGNQILLENKTYNLLNTLIIDKSVTLIGQADTKFILNALDQNGFLITSDNVIIDNIKIEQNASAYEVPMHKHFKHGEFDKRDFIKKGTNFNSGIRVLNAKNVTIRNCEFQNWVGDGVLVFGSSHVEVLNNTFYSPYYVQYTADIHVKGKPQSPCLNIKIIGNKCTSNNRHGISVGNGGYVSDVLVESNEVICDYKKLGDKFLRNHGILAFYGAEHIPENSNIRILNNKISGTRNTGIYVPGGYEVEIKGNILNNIGLVDGVKISGGILVGNDLESVLIEGNSIYNYKGTFDERGAISTFGATKGNNGEIVIRSNIIKNSTNGIAIDQEFATVIIEDNETESIEKSSIYLRRNIGVKQKKGVVKIRNNHFKENLTDSIPALRIDGKNILSVSITNNKIIGRKNGTCFRVSADDVEIQGNEINDFGEVLEVKSKGKKKRVVKIQNNKMTNIKTMISSKSDGHDEGLESKNQIVKRKPEQ